MKLKPGHTLLELILGLTVLAIAIPGLLSLFAESTLGGAQTQTLPTMMSLASELMEELRSRPFDELAARDSNNNWSTVLGPDTGEANKSDFDDIDDFDGFTQGFGVGYPNYTASVTVNYVAETDLNSPLVIPSQPPPGWTPAYKRVAISVSHATLAGALTVVTVAAEVL